MFVLFQISDVNKLAETGKVKVVIDKVNGKIKLQGLLSNVSDAVSEANDIIRLADHAKQTGQIEKIVTDMVQWYYLEEDKAKNKTTLKEYPPEVNLILETALKDQKSMVSFYSQDGSKYVIDLNSYEEYPEDDPTDLVQVLRKSKLKGKEREIYKKQMKYTAVNSSPILSNFWLYVHHVYFIIILLCFM
jgi:hypothetical protein